MNETILEQYKEKIQKHIKFEVSKIIRKHLRGTPITKKKIINLIYEIK